MVALLVRSLGRPLLLLVVEAVPVWPLLLGVAGWSEAGAAIVGALPQVWEP